MKQTILKFKGFTVEKMEYLRNTSEKIEEEVLLFPDVLFKLAMNESRTRANIYIGIKLGSEKNLPFIVEAIVKGYFEITDSKLEENQIKEFYLKNGAAILFPYIRSIVTDLTSKSNHNPIILPTINFHNLIEKQELSNIILPNSEYEEFE